MDERMNFTGTSSLLRRYWKTFVAVGLMACVISAVFSGPSFIKPRYRSRAVVYPVNLNSYSIETRADQLLQLMESNSIRDSLIAKYHLAAHYRLDTSGQGGRFALYNLYKERISIEKTRYESAEIEVTDEDPTIARDMVLGILHQTDLLARRLQRENSKQLLTIVRERLQRTSERMDSVEQRLNELRTGSGLLDYKTQTKEVTKGYVRSITGKTGRADKEEISSMLKALEDKGGEFHRLSKLDDQLIKEYGQLQENERQALMDVNKVLTYTNLVVYPEVPDKKVYPVRWLMVLGGMAVALLLCYILLFLRQQQRETASDQRG